MSGDNKKFFGGWILTSAIALILIIAVIVTFFVVTPYPYEEPVKEVKIGVLLPLTGDQSTRGNELLRGIELAVDDIKKNYGITVDLVIEDTQSNVNTALEKFFMLRDLGVPAVLGPSSATEASMVSLYAELYRINLITFGNSSYIDEYENYIFRYMPSDDSYSAIIKTLISQIDYLSEQDDPSIAILYSKDIYGYNLRDKLIEKILEDDINMFHYTTIPIPESITEESLSSLLDEIEIYDPDYVCVLTNNPDTYVTINNAVTGKNSTDAWWIGTDYILDKNVATQLNWDNTIVLSPTRVVSSDYREKYKKRYGTEPEEYSISTIGYDATIVLGIALQNYGKSSIAINDGMRDCRELGLTGAFKFNNEGKRFYGFSLYRLDNKKWRPITWNEFQKFSTIVE